MHSRRLNVLRHLLLTTASAVAVLSLTCEPPRDPKACEGIKVKCMAFSNDGCIEAGGQHVPRRGACDFCEICGKFVGHGALCNVSTPHQSEKFGTVYLTSLCSCGMKCSKQNNGVCVYQKECDK